LVVLVEAGASGSSRPVAGPDDRGGKRRPTRAAAGFSPSRNPGTAVSLDLIQYMLCLAFLAVWALAGAIVVRDHGPGG